KMTLRFGASLARIDPELRQSLKQLVVSIAVTRALLINPGRFRRRELMAKRAHNAHRIAKLDLRRIGALRELNEDEIVLAVAARVVPKPLANAARLDAHDGIEGGIERFRTSEDFHCDGISLEPLAATGQGFLDDKIQERTAAQGLRESAAREDAVQLRAYGDL